MSENSAYYASQLRHELSLRNRAFALQRRLGHVESLGGMPVTVYQPHPTRRRHGNFFDESYAAIVAIPEWRKRLNKVLTQAKSSLPRSGRGWKELDSSMSSDALLMNIFCCPYVSDDPRILALVGSDAAELPQFGWRARVPLKSGRADRTEVDMKLGNMLFEAKLTESDFQSAAATVLRRYRDFEQVFEPDELPRELPRVPDELPEVSSQLSEDPSEPPVLPRELSEARDEPTEDGSELSNARRESPENPDELPEAPGQLPQEQGKLRSYQLIRNVLAAYASDCGFCVLLDARRPDLIESWYAILRCVRPMDLRVRCKVLTWQELCTLLPEPLREFLDAKYGIVAPGQTPSPIAADDDSEGKE